MAVLSDYTSGTITIIQNSVNFTGTDTLWRTMRFREGDTVQLQGYTMVIKGVDEPGLPIESNTSGQFTEPWPGTSGTFEYRMRYMSDGARVSGQSAELIELLGNGVLENIADIPVEDGKLLIGNAAGQYEPIDKDELGTPDPNGSLGKLAALTLAARQLLQTDATGALKQVALDANKAIVTDANKDVQQIDLGTLGRTLLALATGTSAQYVQGDGTLQAKAGLPISTDTQSALNGKLNTSGGQMSGNILFRRDVPTIEMRAPGGGVGYDVYANVSNSVNGGLNIRDVASNSVFLTIGGSTIGAYRVQVTGGLNVTGAVAKGSGTFLIDHPLDPFNRNLRHGFVEAPRYDLIYRGTVQLVNGRAMVDIDAASNMTSGTFAALTTNTDVYSVFNRTSPKKTVHATEIADGKFELVCLDDEQSTDRVTWLVIAERNDPFVKSDLDPNTDSDGRFIPEFDKPEYVNEQTEDAKDV